MKVASSNTGIVFSNTIRGVSSSLLNAFVCFGFIALNLQTDLKIFVVFFTVSNLLLIILNWGLKDYSVKLFASQTDTKNVFSKLFSLRISLFFVLGIILAFVPLDLKALLFILVFTFFRSGNNVVESYSVSKNKNFAFACVDLISLASLVIAYLLNFNFSSNYVFYLIICAEILKMLIGFILFYNELSFQFMNPFSFLKETKNYFLVAFFSFLLSKADFYISSLYLGSKELINYHIYSSLIGLSQVIITAFFSRQMVIWFKSKEEHFLVDKRRFLAATFFLSAAALPFFYFITLYFYKFNISSTMLVLVFFNLFIYSFLLLEIYLNTHQNKHGVILTGVLISSTINVLLSFIFIRFFDVLGAISLIL
ncbi:MAG: hypothetical protein ABIP51_12745 [Bacteroidia bacterium]